MLKLRGLYYITHIDNLPSILDKGILCHKRIEEEKIQFTPIYDAEIVESRKNINTPDNRSLWDFANLYFQPRNAMLYRVVFFSGKNIDDIIIIGIKSSILARSDIFITTGNAVSPYSNILSASEAKKNINNIRKQTDKEWWAFEDGSKRELMAECLFLDKVSPDNIQEIYVASRNVLNNVKTIIGDPRTSIIPEPSLFFLPSRKINITENLSLVEGDMFFSRMQTLTISVNTVSVMGKGLASRTKYQFPDVYVAYKRETSLDYLLADEPERLTNTNFGTWFLLFPTKCHWKEMADIKGIEDGLKWLVNNYKKEGIKSLSIPALGCGLGWLDWGMVGPLLCNYLQNLDIPVNLYLPVEKKIPDDQLSKDFLLGKNL
ncbi:hypothetical protein ES703_49528 [subsurface metagenome]